MNATNSPLRGPLFRWLLGLTAAYTFVAVLTEAQTLLTVQNGLLVALCFGLVVKYAPAALVALSSSKPRQGEMLTLGIFLGAVGTLALRVIVFVRYGFNVPSAFGSDLSTFATFLLGLAVICQLAAPEAKDDWRPRKTWIEAGLWLAFGAVLLVGVVMWRGIV